MHGLEQSTIGRARKIGTRKQKKHAFYFVSLQDTA